MTESTLNLKNKNNYCVNVSNGNNFFAQNDKHPELVACTEVLEVKDVAYQNPHTSTPFVRLRMQFSVL